MPEASLDSWLSHLETLHPKKIDLGLDRLRRVATRLDLIPTAVKTVTVAGTNGKGTCVAALDALLRASGRRTGVYTSPHLIRFNERIVIDGEPATDREIVTAFVAIEGARGDISLSYFEFATLAALWLFREAGVDWQVLEVGLGGRLDAVNLIDADACVITSIGLDHTEWLGETREQIAPEKAGVARAGRPAIVAEPDPPATLLPALDERGARTLLRNRDWSISDHRLTDPRGSNFDLPGVPGLRPDNLAAAVVALEALGIPVDQALIDRGLGSLSLAGRQQCVTFRAREIWFDVAHNRESVAALFTTIADQPPVRVTHGVFGGMADKPLRDMIALASPHIDEWHLPAADEVPRAASPAAIGTLLAGASVVTYDGPEAAWEGVLRASEPGDRIVIFGSFVTVGAQLHLMADEQTPTPGSQ